MDPMDNADDCDALVKFQVLMRWCGDQLFHWWIGKRLNEKLLFQKLSLRPTISAIMMVTLVEEEQTTQNGQRQFKYLSIAKPEGTGKMANLLI